MLASPTVDSLSRSHQQMIELAQHNSEVHNDLSSQPSYIPGHIIKTTTLILMW